MEREKTDWSTVPHNLGVWTQSTMAEQTSKLDMEDLFKVIVKNIFGKSIMVWVRSMDQVSDLKQKTQNVTGISASLQSLIFSGKVL